MSCVTVCVCATLTVSGCRSQTLRPRPIVSTTSQRTSGSIPYHRMHTHLALYLAGGRDSVRVALHSTSDDRPSRQTMMTEQAGPRSSTDSKHKFRSVASHFMMINRQSHRACCAFALRAGGAVLPYWGRTLVHVAAFTAHLPNDHHHALVMMIFRIAC